MRNVLRIVLGLLEYVSLFLVGYYGIKYAFIAGPIFFGDPLGVIAGGLVAVMFIVHVLKKEGVIRL